MWHDKNQIKEIEPDVFLVWKEFGNTPLQELERVREQLALSPETKMTYAGRLDPAAEGELLVLVGEACKRKDAFLELDKTYQFKVLLGFATDTLDLLGLVTDASNKSVNLSESEVSQMAKNITGNQRWPYPAYSSRTVDGIPLWQWTREGKYENLLKNNLVPVNDFEIRQLDYLGQEAIRIEELLNHIEIICQKVTGDFRQEQILHTWQSSLDDQTEKSFIVLKFETTLSSGGYVRQIAEHLGDLLGYPTTTYAITRTKIHPA